MRVGVTHLQEHGGGPEGHGRGVHWVSGEGCLLGGQLRSVLMARKPVSLII